MFTRLETRKVVERALTADHGRTPWRARTWRVVVGFLLGAVCLGTVAVPAAAPKQPPNFVVIFLDDAGWGDFRPFGDTAYPTPNVQRLAEEGCRYDNFYVPQAVCSASRAALLTGCNPGRTKVFGAYAPRVRGLDPQYATLGEVLRAAGYATASFGKWHVGDHPETRPHARGFDESCGLMVSNDMWEFHPENPDFWGRYPLQYWDNGRVTIERVTPEHQTLLTTWITERAVDFIGRHRARPFLLYVPHPMPHVPLYVSDKFEGKSGAGLYGDVMMELDWSVGEIVRALEDAGVTDQTLVLFTSDNGPWISYGNHAGVTPFREAKGTGFDGGIRSPCIVKFPGRIAAGSHSTQAFSTIDILPTFAELAGAALPRNPIDGRNVWDLMIGKAGAVNPHDYYPFSTGQTLEGVISGDGRWKLHLPHAYRTLVRAANDGAAGQYRQERIELSLFDLLKDPFETRNVLAEEPEVAARLQAWAEAHRQRFYAEPRP